jgi:hypothetical protein
LALLALPGQGGDRLTNECLTGDIAASFGEEVDCRISNITNMPEAAQRLGLGIGSLGVGWEQTFQALDYCQMSISLG